VYESLSPEMQEVYDEIKKITRWNLKSFCPPF
jgi:hypothetical protein